MTIPTERRLAAALVCALLLIAASAHPAVAAACGERGKYIKVLRDKYKETPRGVGLVSERGVVELYTSAGGSWTILSTTTDGRSCVVATGENWQVIKQPVGETDS